MTWRSRRRHLPEYRRKHRRGAALGCAITLAGLSALASPTARHLRAIGPMNVGHEALACSDCHRKSPGTLRQQLQANLRFLTGSRSTPAQVGRLTVDNSVCLDCHERPDDRHPVFRFLEPRFADARTDWSPHLCAGCHLEHRGVRVTSSGDFCVGCHHELEIPDDRLDVTHAELVRQARWSTCLGCHDYHGNHQIDAPRSLDAAASAEEVADYLAGGPAPYPGQPKVRAQIRDRQNARRPRDVGGKP